jgi:hypothetical protein
MARDVRGRPQLVAFSCHDTSKRSQQTTHLLFDHDSIGEMVYIPVSRDDEQAKSDGGIETPWDSVSFVKTR